MSEEIESPCVAICQLDDDELFCIGCFRTPEEIERWPKLSSEEKKQILKELSLRKNQVL